MPARSLEPEVLQVMDEVGLDLRDQRPKPLSVVPMQRVDLVVFLCAHEARRDLPGRHRTLTWILPDPELNFGNNDTRQAAYRFLRDDLRRRIEALAAVPGVMASLR